MFSTSMCSKDTYRITTTNMHHLAFINIELKAFATSETKRKPYPNPFETSSGYNLIGVASKFLGSTQNISINVINISDKQQWTLKQTIGGPH